MIREAHDKTVQNKIQDFYIYKSLLQITVYFG